MLRHHYRDLGNSRLFERHIVDADREPNLIKNVLYDYRFTFPFASSLSMSAPDGRSCSVFDVIQPISVKRSKIYKIVARNYDLQGPFEGAVRFEQQVNE